MTYEQFMHAAHVAGNVLGFAIFLFVLPAFIRLFWKARGLFLWGIVQIYWPKKADELYKRFEEKGRWS